MVVMAPQQLPTVPTTYVPLAPNILGSDQQQQRPQQQSSPDIGGLISIGKQGLSNLTASTPTYAGNLINPLPWQSAGNVINPQTVGSLPAGMVNQPSALATGLTKAGAGLLGGFAAGQVFGNTPGTNAGSAIAGGAAALAGLGPVGLGLGAFLGGGIGSMFGKKKPSNRLQAGGVNMQTGQYDVEGSKLFSQSGDKYSEQNAQIRDAYAMAAADMTKFLRDNGAEQVGDFGNLVIRIGDRTGYDFFYEQPVTSTETVDFRGSQRNAELMNMNDSERNIQSYGKDLNAFGNGLSQSIAEKFKTSPELLAQALEIFNKRVAQGTGQTSTGGVSLQTPMVAGKKSWSDFMAERMKA